MTMDSGSATGTRTMTATEFRAKCLRLMDEVAETGREIVTTKRGRPVARLAPIRHQDSIRDRSMLGPGLGARGGSHPHPNTVALPQERDKTDAGLTTLTPHTGALAGRGE